MGRVRDYFYDPCEDEGNPTRDEPMHPAEAIDHARWIGGKHEVRNVKTDGYRVKARCATSVQTFIFPDATSATLAFNDMTTHLTNQGFDVVRKASSMRFEAGADEWFEIGMPVPA